MNEAIYLGPGEVVYTAMFSSSEPCSEPVTQCIKAFADSAFVAHGVVTMVLDGDRVTIPLSSLVTHIAKK